MTKNKRTPPPTMSAPGALVPLRGVRSGKLYAYYDPKTRTIEIKQGKGRHEQKDYIDMRPYVPDEG